MKKLLTVLLSLMLAVSLSVAVLSVSAKDTRSIWNENTNYNRGNAMDVYQAYVENDKAVGGALNKVENLFGAGAYANSWYKPDSSLKINEDSTAVMYPNNATGHVLKNFAYAAGTFVMSFNLEVNEDVNLETDFNTAAGKGNISQFWGFEFMNTAKVGNSWENLSVPWSSPGGYPYVISFDGETGPDDETSLFGKDGKATLPDGTLCKDAYDENPDQEMGRLYQTGLTVRKYKNDGSHNYFRWSSANPTNAVYVNSINQDCHSLVPDYARAVRLEDVWDGKDHTLVVQFQPMSKDNGDGVDAVFIDIWMSNLTPMEGDETREIGGQVMTHVMRIYDEMPYDDPESSTVDKRTEDGTIVLWTHDDYAYESSADQWNTKVNISEFYLLNSASYTAFDVNRFPELSGPAITASTVEYDGQAHSFDITGMDENMKVTFFDANGDEIATGLENTPTYTNAGEYYVKAKFSKAGFKPIEREATLVIEKVKTRVNGTTRQSAEYDGQPHALVAVAQDIERNEIAELQQYLTYSPSKEFTEVGTYTVIVSLPETTNYLGSFKKFTFTIKGSGEGGGGSTGDAQFTEDEIAAMTWEATNLSEDNKAVYDGSEHCLYLTNLPEGATVEYNNNVKINAGTYTVTATVSKDGYADYTMTTTMTIDKAEVEITAEETQTFFFSNTDLTVKATASNGATVECTPVKEITENKEVTLTVAETENYKGATKVIKVSVVLDVKE